MAAGDLSADQARYVDLVAQATGLSRAVVVAWVGAESGWGVNKAGHNYLNIGPGRTYSSTGHAAAAAAALINASDYYVGIRAAIPAGGAAQVQAIGASPWGTNGAVLGDVYQQLAGGGAVQTVGLEFVPGIPFPLPESPLPGIKIPGTDKLPGAGVVGDAISGAAGDVAGAVVGALGPILIEAGLTLIFTVAAFAFVAIGVNRLTGGSLKSVFDTVSKTVGAAGGVAKLAAV